jgi:hypothetical protein
MRKKDIENLICPFCGGKIKGKIPEGLSIKKIIELVNTINNKMNKGR